MEASKLRNGVKIMMNDEPWVVMTYVLRPQSRWSAKMITKLKNLLTWVIVEKTFSSAEHLPDADIANSRAQYLYRSWDDYIFMDNETYDQFEFSSSKLWDQVKFLADNMDVGTLKWNWNVINIELAPTVNLEVTETDPWVRWDTATWWSKPATLETWATVQVPFFINIWDKLVINTQTWEYKERVK